jgi:hypothetical protein
MAFEMAERLFKKPYSTDLNHKQFSSQGLLDTLDEQHKWMVKANEDLTLARPVVEQAINVEGPFKIIPVGDTHLFSIYSYSEAVKRTLSMLDQDNAFGIVTGDFIEGMNSGIPDHPGSVELNFGRQIVAAAEILRPYFYKGKLLAASEGYFGHEGWAMTRSGISAVEMMARLMPRLDPKDPMNTEKWKYLPVLIQGGLLKLKLDNGRPYIIKVMHDPGNGGSDTINRSGSLKKKFLDEDDDLFLEHGEHADMIIAGHLHHRAVASKEIWIDRMSRQEKSIVFVQVGTSKGIDKSRTDPFMTAIGQGPTLGPGPAIIIHQTRGSTNGDAPVTKEWVNYGYDAANEMHRVADTLHKVEDQLNLAERQKLTRELLDKIYSKVKAPKASFNARKSEKSPKEKPGRAALYDDMEWDIQTKNFPILVYLLQNVRYGSASHEGKVYRSVFTDILRQATNNPFKYVLAMRHFIDPDVAGRFDRRSVLNRMADDLAPIHSENRLLGFMLSSSLLSNRWQKDVVQVDRFYDRSNRKWTSDREVDPGFRPGDEIYYRSAIKATPDSALPLYVNESLLRLNLGGIQYTFFLLDKLGRSGSEFNLVQGLVQSRKKSHVDADVTAGGHMPLSGFSVNPPRQRIYLAPGGFSNWDAGGKGNDKRVAVGGQGVVLLADRKMAIPTASHAESVDIFNAFVLDKGLTPEEKKKIANRRK